jgi:hypothetical protein
MLKTDFVFLKPSHVVSETTPRTDFQPNMTRFLVKVGSKSKKTLLHEYELIKKSF